MIRNIVPAPIAALPWLVMLWLTLLAAFGTVVLYSAAGGSFSPWAANHFVRFLVFLVMAVVISRLPHQLITQSIYPVYAVILVMLLAVELIGQVGGGSQRWLNLGFIQLQPSELMKPAVILALARFYDVLPIGKLRSFDAIWPALLLMALPCALVLLQPDLGTTITIFAGGLVIMFLAGLPARLFIGGAVIAIITAPMAFIFGLQPYQQKRVLTFLNPEDDLLGTGYHITQSKIAIGSGGLTGKGFLQGSQSHLDYLPEGHTDFVFATMAEEWGLVGGLVVLVLFGLLFNWGLRTAMNARTHFGKLAAAGLTATIFFYFAINLLMVMGFAPVVGIPLPFLSHGGSSMLTIMICVGLIMGVERNSRSKTGAIG